MAVNGFLAWPGFRRRNNGPRSSGNVLAARNLAAWQAAWQRQQGGYGQAHIGCYGDSITQGFYTDAQYYANGWPGLMAAELARRTGQPAGSGWIPLYESRDITTIGGPANDDRITLNGTWAVSASLGFFDRGFYTLTNGDTMVFGPVNCDGFRINYSLFSGGGTWNASVDGGSSTAFSSSGGATGLVAVGTMGASSYGSHTLTCTATTGVGMYINAVETLVNTGRGVKVSRIAYSGKRFNQLMNGTSNVSSAKMAPGLAPDLALLIFGVNEADQFVSLATMFTQYLSYVLLWQAAGSSVAMVIPPPPSVAAADAPTWDQYAAVIRAVAQASGVALIDLPSMLGGTNANAAKWMYDNYHPNPAGHAEIARLMADQVVAFATT